MIALHEALQSFLAGDAPALSPDVAELFRRLCSNKESTRLHWYAKDYARKLCPGALDWADVVPAQTAPEKCATLIDAFLSERRISAVLTGVTDIDDDTDTLIWRQARARHILACAFIDRPIALKNRFRTKDGETVYPDFIFALDESGKKDLLAMDAPAAVLRISGNLHLRRWLKQARSIPADRLAKIRAAWGVGNKQRAILFVSECAREMEKYGRASGYDELKELERLINILKRKPGVAGLNENGDVSVLVIRPHPRDTVGKYDEYKSEQELRVRIDAQCSAEEAVLAADYIVGLNSALLYEAQALQKPVASMVGVGPFLDLRAIR